MRMVIMALVAILVIGGGGAGAYMYLMPQEIDAEVAKEDEPKEDLGHAAFMELDPFVFSVLGQDKAYHTVSLAVVVELKSDSFLSEVEFKKPRLNHYFLEEMYDSMGKNAGKDTEMTVSEIQVKLMKVGQDILGKDVLSDVLIQLINIRPV